MTKMIAALTGVFLITFFAMIVSAKPKVSKKPFGKTADGRPVYIYTLRNSRGAEAKIMTYGATVVSLKVPDRTGKMVDVVLGFDSVAGYEKQEFYIGSIIGRYANRIAKGRFAIDGRDYVLARNNGENHLHGGPKGFHRQIWAARSKSVPDAAQVILTYLSRDGEEGYPGDLTVEVTYSLTDAGEFKVEYRATSDKDTICNLTQHSYFNLDGSATILDHLLQINADRFTPTDAGAIPTGELRPVKGTPFDFLVPTVIGARIADNDQQLKFGSGYDHNWALNKKPGELSEAATLSSPVSGISLKVSTTENGLQFYSGNFLDGTPGKGGVRLNYRSGLCLEAQAFPDSPNKPSFPSVILRKGKEYKQTTVYSFSISK